MNDLHTPDLTADDFSRVFDHAHLDSLIHEIEADRVTDRPSVHGYLADFDRWIDERSADGSVPQHWLNAFRVDLWFGRGVMSVHDGDIDYFKRSVERCKTTGNTKRQTLSLTRLALSLEDAGLQAASTDVDERRRNATGKVLKRELRTSFVGGDAPKIS